MSLTAPERETIATFSDDGNIATIWTAQRRIVTKLKNNQSAILVAEGRHVGSVWAEFRIPAQLNSFMTKQRRATSTSFTEGKP